MQKEQQSQQLQLQLLLETHVWNQSNFSQILRPNRLIQADALYLQIVMKLSRTMCMPLDMPKNTISTTQASSDTVKAEKR